MDDIIKIDHHGKRHVPDYPVIPFIQGDGVGPEIWEASQRIMDAAIDHAFGSQRKIKWLEIPAGEKSFQETGEWLPEKTLEIIKKHHVAIKGPLTTPVGEGIRSLNVTLRKSLDLYSCVRPVKYIKHVPSPVRHPEKVNITVFRENTEDLYAGIEWESGSRESQEMLRLIEEKTGKNLHESSGIGIKPVSPENTKRLVKKAIEYALDQGLSSITLMHKGNIMKFTEGGFRKWGYEAASDYYPDQTITEKELWDTYQGSLPEGKVVIRDRIADMVFAEVLLKPETFDIIATTNLNGDYISDALAAQVGGLGIAPGANIGDLYAVFEATHGTAPDIAGKNRVNPMSLILSGCMMLEYMGWGESSDLIRSAINKTLEKGFFTYDLSVQKDQVNALSCSAFTDKIIEEIRS